MLDPRTRLVLLTVAIAGLAATPGAEALGAATLSLAVAAAASNALGRVARAWRMALPLSLLVFALTGAGLGWHAALVAVLRLHAILGVSALVFGATPPEDLGNALVAGGVPYPAAFVLVTALHFVPVIARRAAAVRDAQRARGIPLDAGLASLRHYPALTLPVLYQSFKLADELAEAMEARGFARGGRTFRRAYRLGAADWAAIVGAGAALAGYLYWDR